MNKNDKKNSKKEKQNKSSETSFEKQEMKENKQVENNSEDEFKKLIKEIDQAVLAIRVYPVASNENSKNQAIDAIKALYNKGNETTKQLILVSLHENIASSADIKQNQNYDYFKAKNPGLDITQLRLNVYKAMFNYTSSLEGIVEFIKLLGELNSDDAAKVLTHHFAHLATIENEYSHVLRSAILETLGKSNSKYALDALLTYAKYTDREGTYSRVVNALIEWDEKLDELKISDKDKAEVRDRLKDLMTKEHEGKHYG